MKTASKWLIALGFATIGFLSSQASAAAPVCYQATGITGPWASSYVGTLQLVSASCTSTPSGHGWFWVDSAPYELWVAIPYSWPLGGAHYIFYQGEVSGQPDLLLDIVVGEGDDEFPLNPNPPQSSCQVATDRSLVPTMTGGTSPSGSVGRSGVYSSSYEGWKAFDNSTATSWLSNMNASSVWIDYEWGGGALKLVKSYQVKYANGSCCEQRGPKNWTLQGWNGVAWVTVDTVTNQTGWYANGTRTFTVDNPGAYSKYRMNVTADNYGGSYPITLVSIAEILLTGQDAVAQVPVMTGSTSPSGSVTRSGVYSSSYEGWTAFDGSTATSWLSNMNTSSVWIAYEWGGGTAKAVNSYQLKYANGSCCEQRGPKNWTLQGWNGSSWVTVDTVTNQTGWYANGTRSYAVDSPGCYTQYRLNITADNYNNASFPITLVHIAEIQMYAQ